MFAFISPKIFTANPRVGEFARFCLVGGVCTAIDYGVFALLCRWLPYEACAVIAFAVSWLVNYMLTAAWTFRERPTGRNFAGMLLVHLANLVVVRLGLLWLLVDGCALDKHLAYLIALAVSAVASFFMVRLTFKGKF